MWDEIFQLRETCQDCLDTDTPDFKVYDKATEDAMAERHILMASVLILDALEVIRCQLERTIITRDK
jgi:hypothetical protein